MIIVIIMYIICSVKARFKISVYNSIIKYCPPFYTFIESVNVGINTLIFELLLKNKGFR